MSVFSNIYLRASKNRFKKTFRPTKLRRNNELLIHAGDNQMQFIKAIPLIHIFRKTGNIILVSPSTCTDIINIVNVRFRKVLYFEKPLKVLSPEHSQIIKLLVGNEFDFLFDLGDPANISIPYLANISQRVCIGNRSLLPYYNIIFENADALIDYFNLKPPSSSKLFNFPKSKIKETNKKYNLNTTYVVVNSKRDIKSDHHKFTIGKDIDIENPDIYAIILSSHGYFGEKDHFAEFARLNNITIIG